MKFFVLPVTIFALALSGCGKKEEKLEVPQYTELRNVSEAPDEIKKAAAAIFKIELPGVSATGTFISADGLMLTNNHVLGIGQNSCALEGCKINIATHFQIGIKARPSSPVYATPISVSPELDAAIYQLWNDPGMTTKFVSPTHLEILPVTGAELIRQKVHVVGHPLGGVKKWTAGRVYQQTGKWVVSTNFSLPGSSGSPFLNDQGQIVGLVHRAANGHESITRKGLLTFSIATPAALVLGFKNRGVQRDQFFSVATEHSANDIAKNHLAYFMAGKGEASVTGFGKTHLLDVLASVCDDAMAKGELSSPDKVGETTKACSDAWSWMNCNDPSDRRDIKKCPNAGDRAAWTARFAKVAEKTEAFSARHYLDFLLSSHRLEDGGPAALGVLRKELSGYVTRAAAPLTFDMANRWVNAFGRTPYLGVDATRFLLDYEQQPAYEYSYGDIVHGHVAMALSKIISNEDFFKKVGVFFADEKLDLGTKISLEQICYQSDYFPY